jgi:hypothetical protein
VHYSSVICVGHVMAIDSTVVFAGNFKLNVFIMRSACVVEMLFIVDLMSSY